MSLLRSEPRDDPDGEGWTMFQGGARFPLDDGRTDLGLDFGIVRYDRQAFGGGRAATGAVFGGGFKFELAEDVLALEVPARMSFAGAGTFNTTYLYPRAIVSVPLADRLELNLSATRFVFPASESVGPWGYAAGLAIGRRGGAIFRPEVGVLENENGDRMLQFGIGFTPELPVGGAH